MKVFNLFYCEDGVPVFAGSFSSRELMMDEAKRLVDKEEEGLLPWQCILSCQTIDLDQQGVYDQQTLMELLDIGLDLTDKE